MTPEEIVGQFPEKYDRFLRQQLPDRAAEFRQKLGLDRVIPFALSLRQRNP